MTVTKLEAGSKGRISVYLDGEFAFVLYKGELSKYGIEEGAIVADDLRERVISEVINKRAKLRAMNLLKTRDRTEADVRNKLLDGGYPENSVDEAIEYLKSFNYIDDLRYAGDYIRFKSTCMSKAVIMRNLLQKGVDKDIIEQAYVEHSSDSSVSDTCEEDELICKLIHKKCQNLASLDYTDKMKLFSYLYRKGFERDSIERIFRREVDKCEFDRASSEEYDII